VVPLDARPYTALCVWRSTAALASRTYPVELAVVDAEVLEIQILPFCRLLRCNAIREGFAATICVAATADAQVTWPVLVELPPDPPNWVT
jgi:hypothetical protein